MTGGAEPIAPGAASAPPSALAETYRLFGVTPGRRFGMTERRRHDVMEWSLPAVLDIVSDTAPQREMLVLQDVRRTYGEVARRTRSLASFLSSQGIGVHRERHQLARWECGQSPVALVLHNCPEYIEAMLGCFRSRAVPFNVNQHYTASEIRSLLEMVGAEAVIYHRSLGPLVNEALAAGIRLAIEVDDGSGGPGVPGHVRYDEVVSRRAGPLPVASPDDLYLVCTGGTTGRPKAVLWRQADIYVSAMGGEDETTAERIAQTASAGSGTWFAPPPLMHAPPSGRCSPGSSERPPSSCTTTEPGSTPPRSSRPRPGSG